MLGDAMVQIIDLLDTNIKLTKKYADELAEAKFVLRQLVDLSPCRFDHDGGCQEHGFISLTHGEKCPQQQAKEVLGIG